MSPLAAGAGFVCRLLVDDAGDAAGRERAALLDAAGVVADASADGTGVGNAGASNAEGAAAGTIGLAIGGGDALAVVLPTTVTVGPAVSDAGAPSRVAVARSSMKTTAVTRSPPATATARRKPRRGGGIMTVASAEYGRAGIGDVRGLTSVGVRGRSRSTLGTVTSTAFSDARGVCSE